MSEKPTYEELEQKIKELKEAVEPLQTEDALQQSKRRYQALYENTPGMLHSIDGHGRLVSVSNDWIEVLGYERHEVIGRKSTEFLTEASQRYAEEVVLPEFFKKGVCKNVSYQMVKKNGEIIDILLSAIVERDADGIMVRSIAILTDVTDRIRAEDSLRKSERKFKKSEQELKSILNNAPDIIYRLDPKGNIIYVNQSVEDYGYSTEELIGKNMLDLVHPDDREKAIYRINERRTGDRRTKSFEIRLLTKDLKTVPFESKSKGFGSFLINAEGMYKTKKPNRDSFMGTQGIARDITLRRQAEKALKESEKRFRQLFEYAPDPYYLNDMNGILLDGNKAAEKIIGYKKEELIGKNMFELGLLSPEQLPMVVKLLEKNINGQSTGPDEFKLKTKDGREIFSEILTFPIEINGEPTVLGIARDITQRKQIEIERERLIKELQDALKEIKTLSGFIPICAECKKIRDDEGYWQKLEKFIQDRSDAQFSHSICPECVDKHYPDIDI
jgi:PAS domain S-box-containing protein